MAKQFSFVSLEGFIADSSYWFPASISRNKLTKTGEIVFYGFKDKAARDAGRQQIGIKRYVFSPAQYDTFFDDAIFDAGSDPSKQAYALALASLEDTGKSFFDGAQDV